MLVMAAPVYALNPPHLQIFFHPVDDTIFHTGELLRPISGRHPPVLSSQTVVQTLVHPVVELVHHVVGRVLDLVAHIAVFLHVLQSLCTQASIALTPYVMVVVTECYVVC